MDSNIVIFSLVLLVAIFSVVLPMDSTFAQTQNMMTHDGDEEEEKSCPFKEKKLSINTGHDFS